MKVAIVANCDILSKNNLGIFKKMYGQAKAFLSYNMEVDFFYNKSYMLLKENINSKIIKKITPKSSEDKYLKIITLIEKNEYDIVYVRYTLSDYYFINFLYNIKLINKNTKVIIDFPTYPYDNEIKFDEEILNIDICFRKLLYKYVDFAICYNDVEKIFNIPAYNIGNGVDVSNIKLKNSKKIYDKKEINLISVANISFWHGYDRLIKGMIDYYSEKIQEYEINFYIVGIGNELASLTSLVEENNLNKHVRFVGAKNGKELDDLFDVCQIAIGSLGMYRKALNDGADLKSREYCSRGIPFIFGYEDKDFSENFKYALKVTNDSSNINIKDIIKFYKSLENNNISEEMRKYAEDNLTWNKKMKIILKKI